MQYLIVDGHCDSILEVANGQRSLRNKSNLGHLDFPRLLEAGVSLQFMALFIETNYKPYNALLRTLQLIDIFKQEIKKVDYINTVLKKNDILNFPKDKVKVLLSIEGGEALAGDIHVLRCLFDLGVRSLTLTWNQRNQIADGCGEEPDGKGLSKFGKQVIREMNHLGMLIDVSHLSEKSFWDVVKYSEEPFIASHSCCKGLNNHSRNLSDKQLFALAEKGGVLGINFCPDFLNTNPQKASIDDVIEHIVYASKLIGSEHIGLGSDFDGIDFTPQGLEDVTRITKIISYLEKKGFSSGEIENIMGKSFLRVLEKVLPNE